jgi:hypothetical protein
LQQISLMAFQNASDHLVAPWFRDCQDVRPVCWNPSAQSSDAENKTCELIVRRKCASGDTANLLAYSQHGRRNRFPHIRTPYLFLKHDCLLIF